MGRPRGRPTLAEQELDVRVEWVRAEPSPQQAWAWRCLATLAGINKDNVAAACHRLVALNYLQLERRPRARYEGGYKTFFRLAALHYPRANEPYAVVPGNLFYGGTWALLPSAAYRHLYIVIACLDPIGDEAAYLARIAKDIEEDWDRYADDQAWTIAEPAARVAWKAKRLGHFLGFLAVPTFPSARSSKAYTRSPSSPWSRTWAAFSSSPSIDLTGYRHGETTVPISVCVALDIFQAPSPVSSRVPITPPRVAVGTPVTRRPPHRFRRAAFPHRAPASGDGAQVPAGACRTRAGTCVRDDPAL